MSETSSDDMTTPSATETEHSDPYSKASSPPRPSAANIDETIMDEAPSLFSTSVQSDIGISTSNEAGTSHHSTESSVVNGSSGTMMDTHNNNNNNNTKNNEYEFDWTGITGDFARNEEKSPPRVASVLNGTRGFVSSSSPGTGNSESQRPRDNDNKAGGEDGANNATTTSYYGRRPSKTINSQARSVSFSDLTQEQEHQQHHDYSNEEIVDLSHGYTMNNEEEGITSFLATKTNQSNDALTTSGKTEETHSDKKYGQEEKKSANEHIQIEPEGTTTLMAKNASRRFDDEILKEVLLDVQQRFDPDELLNLQEDESQSQMLDGRDHDLEECASKKPSWTPAKSLKEISDVSPQKVNSEGGRTIQSILVPTPQIIEVPQRTEQHHQYGPYKYEFTHTPGEYFHQYHGSENVVDAASVAASSSAPSQTPPPPMYEGQRHISPSSREHITGPHMGVLPSITTSQRTLTSPTDRHQNMALLYPQAEAGIPHLPPLSLPPQLGHGGGPANGYHPHLLANSHGMNGMSGGGKRRIHLRLVEDKTSSTMQQPEKSSFLSFRRRSILRNPIHSPIKEEVVSPAVGPNQWIDHGSLTISWYEGTSSLELQEHVRNSLVRKLGLKGTTKLADFRVLDESVDPPEEIVLCPYIPDGSRLLLRFTTKDAGGEATPKYAKIAEYYNGPPESPSAAPSPYPRSVDLEGLGLNANQLALLGARLRGLQMPQVEDEYPSRQKLNFEGKRPLPKVPTLVAKTHEGNATPSKKDDGNESHEKSADDEEDNSKGSNMEVASLHPEDQIQKSLRDITEILLAGRAGVKRYEPRQEKRQVIFVLANYFVLFLSLIAISAEIQARAPTWHATMERHLQNVQDCSKDHESLFRCVESGDMAGLVASVLLWISRSAATKRIFLFGFESPKKLWTVVYESLVTAVCWAFSYLFIRRGMNPDTNRNFLQKYWKDTVYGFLAGFNAAFMKHVLKNLIPQEAIEDALQERQLKILSWLPSFNLPSTTR